MGLNGVSESGIGLNVEGWWLPGPPWWLRLAMQETMVQSLGWEDALEKGMATHSGILVWRILWIEEPGRLQSMGSQRVRHDPATNIFMWGLPSAMV